MDRAEFKAEVDALKADGYEITDYIVRDWGRTLGVIVKREQKYGVIMLSECFYDTNPDGNITKVHGVLDIRTTPWSKKIRSGL
jgi:hypothetical protein